MKFSPDTCPMRVPLMGNATSLVVFLHGYGADGNDLLSISDVWAQDLPYTAFLSPHAPQPCFGNPFGGRQWFPLTTLSENELNLGTQNVAPELIEFIESAQDYFNVEKIALVGFSQGAMMAMHVAFRMEKPPVAVVGYSGRLTNAATLIQDIKNKPPIFLAHGTHDAVVPFESMNLAEKIFKNAQISVETYAAEGLGHGIDEQMLIRAGVFLKTYLM